GLGYGWLGKPVTERDAAKTMDRQETSDAVTTALDHLESDHPVALLQRADAERAADRYLERLKDHLPWPGRKLVSRYAVMLVVLWIGAAVLVFIPNPMDERIAAKAAAERQLEELNEQIDELEEVVEQTLGDST